MITELAAADQNGVDIGPREDGRRTGIRDDSIGTGSAWVSLMSLQMPMSDKPRHFSYVVEGYRSGQTPIVVRGSGWTYGVAGTNTLGEEVLVHSHARVRLASDGGTGLSIQAQQHATQDWRFLVRLRDEETKF